MADDVATYNGTLIKDLLGLVDRVLVPGPEARQLAKSAFELAYFDGRFDGVREVTAALVKVGK